MFAMRYLNIKRFSTKNNDVVAGNEESKSESVSYTCKIQSITYNI
jgi:hypothetical protein